MHVRVHPYSSPPFPLDVLTDGRQEERGSDEREGERETNGMHRTRDITREDGECLAAEDECEVIIYSG